MKSERDADQEAQSRGLIIGWFEVVFLLVIAVLAGAYAGKLWADHDRNALISHINYLEERIDSQTIKIVDPFRLQSEVSKEGLSAEKVADLIKQYAVEASASGVMTIFPSQIYEAPEHLFVTKEDILPGQQK